jgi:hypothetical protein
MSVGKHAVGVRGTLMRVALCGLLGAGLGASPAFAAKIGPNFPIPNGFPMTGSVKDSLLKIQELWLKDGIENLRKARAEADKSKASAKPEETAALDEKLKKFDADIEATQKELEIATNDSPEHEVQRERKRLFLLNLNQWINELNHLATQQMKKAIMSDGAEAEMAQNRNYQLSQQADDLEKAKHDITIEDWAATR